MSGRAEDERPGSSPSAEIPFTHFRGQVKQMDSAYRFPLMRDLFETTFAAFRNLDAHYANLLAQGLRQIVSAAGVEVNFGFRPRRFSGGPGLPSGRYFTLCEPPNYADRGTLRDEITAYYSSDAGITASIFDPMIDLSIVEYLRSEHAMPDELASAPFYFLVYRVDRATDENAALIESYENVAVRESTAFTYGVHELEADIERVIDLRDPDTQSWFTETFVRLELENEERASSETRIVFMPKREISSFGELLPVLVSLETGGGMIFGQAVGHWLRDHGAAGLIFPGARSNAFVRVGDGEPVEWGGWNLVVYADASEPIAMNMFGRMGSWRDSDHDHIHVRYIDAGRERGSFSIRGVREYNLFSYDLKKRIAAGVTENNPHLDITGVTAQKLSDATNLLLDSERAERSPWYEDIDYTELVHALERRWREDRR